MFRRGDRGGDKPGPNVYQMKQQMLSIGDDFWIENGAGERVFKVDGKVLRIRKTLHLQDAAVDPDPVGATGPALAVALVARVSAFLCLCRRRGRYRQDDGQRSDDDSLGEHGVAFPGVGWLSPV